MRKFLLAAGVAIAATLACGGSSSTDASNQPQWLQVQRDNRPSGYNWNGVARACDTETGNLLYFYGDIRGGIAVVPGGCK